MLTPRKQWLVDSVWHLFVVTVTCCLCFTSFSFVTLSFDEETTVLESYEVACLMHAPARRRSTDHTCLLDPGYGAFCEQFLWKNVATGSEIVSGRKARGGKKKNDLIFIWCNQSSRRNRERVIEPSRIPARLNLPVLAQCPTKSLPTMRAWAISFNFRNPIAPLWNSFLWIQE